MKASDVDEAAVIRAIQELAKHKPLVGASRWELELSFRDVPPKVLMAKLRSMVRRKVLDGCDCGCRGDFVVVAALGEER